MTVTICIGSSCHLKGSRKIVARMDQLIREKGLNGQVELSGSFCMNNCANGVSVKIDDVVYGVSPENVDEFFEKEVVGRL